MILPESPLNLPQSSNKALRCTRRGNIKVISDLQLGVGSGVQSLPLPGYLYFRKRMGAPFFSGYFRLLSDMVNFYICLSSLIITSLICRQHWTGFRVDCLFNLALSSLEAVTRMAVGSFAALSGLLAGPPPLSWVLAVLRSNISVPRATVPGLRHSFRQWSRLALQPRQALKPSSLIV